MISLIIPTYRNPDYLDICLKSATEQQDNDNEIIVVIDGFQFLISFRILSEATFC